MRASLTKRIGLLVPSSNSVMEVDFYRHVPSGTTVHTARMFMEDTTVEGESRMLDEFCFPAAHALATVRPDVIVFGCTSAGALRGNDYDTELCRRLSNQTGAPVVSTIRSVIKAISGRGARRIGVITPYVEQLNQKIAQSLVDEGLEVAAIHGLGITENFSIAEVSAAEIADFAARSFAGEKIELLFASCTNFRALDAVTAIEDKLGVPVMTSNLAALEGACEPLGLDKRVMLASEKLAAGASRA